MYMSYVLDFREIGKFVLAASNIRTVNYLSQVYFATVLICYVGR